MHEYEVEFSHTLDNNLSIPQMAAKGKVYDAIAAHPEMVTLSQSRKYTGEIRIDPESWALPAGAYGEDAGPS